jgi:vancomycin resistance protein YoaR
VNSRYSARTYYGRNPRRGRRRSRRLLILLAPGLLALSLVALVGIAFAGSSDRIAAGVEISGVDVGGLTAAEAHKKLEQTAAKVAWRPVEFVAANRHFRVAPAQLGIQADWDAAIETARRDGDGFGPLRGLTRLKVRFFGTDVVPPVRHSSLALKLFLSRIARAVDRPTREPALVLNGSKPSIVSGHRGQELDRRLASRLVIRALSALSRDRVNLPVKVVTPKVSRADMMRVMGQIRTAVSAPVRIRLVTARWRISPAKIEKMLVYPHDGERSLHVATDKSNALLNALAKKLDRPAKDATFAVSGRSVGIAPSRPGRVLDREGTAAAILRAALDPTRRFASVVMETSQPNRTTEEAKAMGITGLVGSYETTFSGTANRIHNVQLVAALIDSKFIAPGAVFSFNQTTGERNAQKGFRSAPVIINGELTDALGGGICQVSTTVFNAAFESGLPIVERTNHALYISHYPLGRDATVNWPSTDLKFRNDTGHWLLLRTFASYDTLLVALYGTPQHRRVVSEAAPLHVDGPPPVKNVLDPTLLVGKKVIDDFGESSSSTSVRRRVYDADGKLLYDGVFYSRYRSTSKVVRIGTKKPEKKPTKTNTTKTNTTTTDTTTTDTTGDGTTPIVPPGEPIPTN